MITMYKVFSGKIGGIVLSFFKAGPGSTRTQASPRLPRPPGANIFVHRIYFIHIKSKTSFNYTRHLV